MKHSEKDSLNFLDDKVVLFLDDTTLAEEELFQEESEYEENDDEQKLRLDLQDMVDAKQPWYIRILNACAFFILAFTTVIFACVIAIASAIGFVKYCLGHANWNSSLLWWWKLCRRCMVLTLTAFVGIFNVQFALTILAVYFSLFDNSSSIISKLAEYQQ